MLITTSFVIARTWKQPRCFPTKEWIKKMWHNYTLEYYSAGKKNDILNFACTMDGNRKHHPERGNPDPKR